MADHLTDDLYCAAARRAFETGVVAVRADLYRFARSLTRCPERTHDLVQDTLLRAFANHDKFVPHTSLKPWLFCIMRNLHIDQGRAQARRPPTTPLESCAIERSLMSHDHAVVYETREDLTNTFYDLVRLGREGRDTVVAVHYLGMRHVEVAVRLSISCGTSRSRLNRATKKLRELRHTPNKPAVDLTPWAQATSGLSPDDPYYPIAAAYEALYKIAIT